MRRLATFPARASGIALVVLALAVPARVMAVETVVTVQRSPVVVYGLVALLLGALVLGVVAALPWPGRGRPNAAKELRPGPHMRFATGARGDLPWMPGGDILGRGERRAPAQPVAERGPDHPAQPPATQSANDAPVPWSTGTLDSTRWPRPPGSA